MEITQTDAQFVEWISDALRLRYEEEGEQYKFRFRGNGTDKTFTLAKNTLSDCLVKLRLMSEVNETVISEPRIYEVLVSSTLSILIFEKRTADRVS
jgi:hypothetical protein